MAKMWLGPEGQGELAVVRDQQPAGRRQSYDEEAAPLSEAACVEQG
ncbi:hypothetical protein ACH4Y0_02935 [Streptomyces sp. NPDC020707]